MLVECPYCSQVLEPAWHPRVVKTPSAIRFVGEEFRLPGQCQCCFRTYETLERETLEVLFLEALFVLP